MNVPLACRFCTEETGKPVTFVITENRPYDAQVDGDLEKSAEFLVSKGVDPSKFRVVRRVCARCERKSDYLAHPDVT